jgi:hypothetical protein
MRHHEEAVMNSPSFPEQSSTPPQAVHAAAQGALPGDDDDVALGWECANPALQIDVWGSEASAQPLHSFY